jgi:hypothetical protein
VTPPVLRQLREVIVVCALLAFAPSLGAQGTAPVPLDDPAYAYLDRLEELGVVDSAVMGQRPYSFREMRRLAVAVRGMAAARRAGESERALVESLLSRLEVRVAERAGPWPSLSGDGLLAVNANDAVRRGLPRAGAGSSPHATIDPLAVRRLGDPAARGRTAAVELLQRAEPASWLALHARERVELRDPQDTVLVMQHASLLEGAMRIRWRNVALGVGRHQLGWGSGGEGGLFLAADGPALDQLTLASDRPFLLPGFLRRAGPVSGTFTLAELGPSAVRSHSKMLAYKLSARPNGGLEVGATFQNHFGGEGGRASPFWNRVIDFLPIIDIFRRHNYVDTTVVFDVDSDKLIGVDARWRIDRLGGVIVAGEWLMDDFDAQRLISMLNYAGSHALSITVPRLRSPEWSLQLSATHMGPLTYNHATLLQGMTTRGRLLGSELGPDVKSFGGELRWIPTAAMRLSLEGRSCIYSDTRYSAGYDLNGRWRVNKISAAPDELRELGIATLALDPTPATSLTLRLGASRTRNVMFVGGTRYNWVVDGGVRKRL